MNFRESLPGSLSDAGRIRGETQAKKVTHELEADGKQSNKKDTGYNAERGAEKTGYPCNGTHISGKILRIVSL